MYSHRTKIPQGRFKFKVGDLARIIKENLTFAKGYEQTDIFRIVKVIQRVQQII